MLHCYCLPFMNRFSEKYLCSLVALLAFTWGSAIVPLRAATPENSPQLTPLAEVYTKSIRPMLMKSCSLCHDPEDTSSEIDFLHHQTADEVASARSMWRSVAMQLSNRTMPPEDEEQPTEEERLQMVQWIEAWLQETACRQGDYAGQVTTRRLNRKEYDNTIRDLIGLELDFSDRFPVDGAGGEGFDNNGETLFLPPLLMERYLEAAQEMLDLVVITPPLAEEFLGKDLKPAAKEEKKLNDPRGRLLQSGEEVAYLQTIHLAGDYQVKVEIIPQQNLDAQIALKIDGIVAHRYRLEKNSKDAQAKQYLTTKIRLSRGLHRISFRCVGKDSELELVRGKLEEIRKKPTQEKIARHEQLFGKENVGESEQELRAAARKVLTRFARRAFRRPINQEEIDLYLTLFDRAISRGDTYEEAMKLPLKGILVSPHFLFRIEQEPSSEALELISSYELASRLSYFLWSSMPDETLFQLAESGALQDEEVLREQVRRMLQDPKSFAFVESFVGQWLGTREVGGRVVPDPALFKGIYYSDLAVSMRAEPVMMMQYLLQENRSILEFLDADYTFLNQKLAKHYGISGIRGDKFRKVELKTEERGGILGFGAVHVLTSFPRRTSAVLRGAWVLETLLGIRVPSPPDDVPSLDERRKETRNMTMREKLEHHRKNPACAACHNLMDPIGFGLENYDAIGRWRTEADKKPLDVSGVMPSGEKFEGPNDLKEIILNRKDEFIHHLCERMLGYALGRSLEDQDACTIQTIAHQWEREGYQAQTLIEEVVLSTPFRFRQQLPEATSH
ncbi:Cytochrome c domain-containing protein [Planctomycetales bacterium 10988]|nr:Cytochrome c domain-containing protein [Planctomycetales bacterium 10988]